MQIPFSGFPLFLAQVLPHPYSQPFKKNAKVILEHRKQAVLMLLNGTAANIIVFPYRSEERQKTVFVSTPYGFRPHTACVWRA